MRQRLHAMKYWAILLVGGLLAGPALAGEAAKARFSQTLSTSEFVETGLNRLSSDQIAVLDALVRRDLVSQAAPARRGDPPAAARFSQRLTDDERRNSGLATLTATELAQLDTLADRNLSAVLARTLLAPPVFLAPGAPVRPEDGKTAPEIHGTLSLSYGMGKGGYSEKAAGMMLRLDNPVHGFSLNVGYSESQVKSPFPYRVDSTAGPIPTPAP